MKAALAVHILADTAKDLRWRCAGSCHPRMTLQRVQRPTALSLPPQRTRRLRNMDCNNTVLLRLHSRQRLSPLQMLTGCQPGVARPGRMMLRRSALLHASLQLLCGRCSDGRATSTYHHKSTLSVAICGMPSLCRSQPQHLGCFPALPTLRMSSPDAPLTRPLSSAPGKGTAQAYSPLPVLYSCVKTCCGCQSLPPRHSTRTSPWRLLERPCCAAWVGLRAGLWGAKTWR